MLHILIFTVLITASASQLNGYGNTTADFGGEVHYRCTLGNPKGVVQVTWERLFKDGSTENLATNSKRFGQHVNSPFTGKVVFTEASLSSTSITLRNVSWQDESCYLCIFNVYPDGSQKKEMCLTVQGISTVSTNYVPRSDPDGGDTEVVFSCSATGKPAPTIDWIISPGVNIRDQGQSSTVRNSDQTFTSSRNITLKVPPAWDGHVDCLLNNGTRGQRQKRIDFSLEQKTDAPDAVFPQGTPAPDRESGAAAAVTATTVTLTICIAVAALVYRKRLKARSRNENV